MAFCSAFFFWLLNLLARIRFWIGWIAQKTRTTTILCIHMHTRAHTHTHGIYLYFKSNRFLHNPSPGFEVDF